MDKLFLCQIPRQKPELTLYEAMDNKRLNVEEAYAYPLHLLMHAYAEKDDHVRVLLTYNNDEEDLERIHEVKAGVLELQKKIGFQFEAENPEDFILLRQEFKQSLKYQLQLFFSLLDQIKDAQEIYADISFGNKPTPIIMAKLLEYIQKTRKTKIGHVIYANLDFTKEKDEQGLREGYIYDISPLFDLSRQIDLVVKSKASDPDELLGKLLSF